MRSQNRGQPLQLAGSLAAESVLCIDIWTGAVDVDYRNRLRTTRHRAQRHASVSGTREALVALWRVDRPEPPKPSLCTAMVAESAFAKQRFNPAKCSQTAYSACLHDVGPYCRKDAASEPAAMRAVERTACLARDIKAPAERFIATDDVRSGNYDGSGFGSS